MCPFIYAHAHAHTLILGIIAGGAGVSWKREGGEIQTRHTEKPNDLYIFLQKKKKVGTNPKDTTLEFLFPYRLASQS